MIVLKEIPDAHHDRKRSLWVRVPLEKALEWPPGDPTVIFADDYDEARQRINELKESPPGFSSTFESVDDIGSYEIRESVDVLKEAGLTPDDLLKKSDGYGFCGLHGTPAPIQTDLTLSIDSVIDAWRQNPRISIPTEYHRRNGSFSNKDLLDRGFDVICKPDGTLGLTDDKESVKMALARAKAAETRALKKKAGLASEAVMPKLNSLRKNIFRQICSWMEELMPKITNRFDLQSCVGKVDSYTAVPGIIQGWEVCRRLKLKPDEYTIECAEKAVPLFFGKKVGKCQNDDFASEVLTLEPVITGILGRRRVQKLGREYCARIEKAQAALKPKGKKK